jgi:hypothetical protein
MLVRNGLSYCSECRLLVWMNLVTRPTARLKFAEAHQTAPVALMIISCDLGCHAGLPRRLHISSNHGRVTGDMPTSNYALGNVNRFWNSCCRANEASRTKRNVSRVLDVCLLPLIFDITASIWLFSAPWFFVEKPGRILLRKSEYLDLV